MSQAPQASLSSSMQINLTGAQRLGILAAVALSSSLVFLFYTNKKPRLVCGDAIESPRSRFLNFLSFGSEPSAAAAACAPVAEDCTAARPTRLDASTTPQPEGAPSCPHNPGPLGPNMCLQCAETKFINILERSRLSEWSWACPNALSPATAPGRPSSPSPGTEEPGIMESLLPAALSPSSYASLSYGSPTSDCAAHASGSQWGLPFGWQFGSELRIPSQPTVDNWTTPIVQKITRTSKVDEIKDILKTTSVYVLFWYISTIGVDMYRDSKTGTFLKGFPAPYWVHAFGFVFQAFVAYEVQRCCCQFAPPANFACLASSMSKVIPAASATFFDMAIDLPQGGFDDQFNILCKSGALLFVLILAFTFHQENFSISLTVGVTCLTTGSLLTIAKALDQTYEFEDLVALVMGAFASAMRWTSTQHFLQHEGYGTPFATLGLIAQWLAVIAFAFAIAFEPSWGKIRMHQFFYSWTNLLEGLGEIFLFYVLWTLEVVAEMLLISKTSAVTFLVIKLVKNVAEKMGKIVEKGFFYEDRPSVRRNKMMNEETIGLHYIAIGLLLFVYHRYQTWLADKGQGLSGCQASNLNNKNNTNNNNGRPQSSNQKDKNNTNDDNGGPQSSNQDISANPSSAQRNNMLLPRQIARWSFRNRAFGNQSSRSKNKQPTLKTTKSNKNICLWN